MQRAPFFFMQVAAQGLPRAGDSVVDAVHRVLKGERVEGDAGSALDALVRDDMLTPQAAYYLRGFQGALNELQQAFSRDVSR